MRNNLSERLKIEAILVRSWFILAVTILHYVRYSTTLDITFSLGSKNGSEPVTDFDE